MCSRSSCTVLDKEVVEMVHDVGGKNRVQEGVDFHPLGGSLALGLGGAGRVVVKQGQKRAVRGLLEHSLLLQVGEQTEIDIQKV